MSPSNTLRLRSSSVATCSLHRAATARTNTQAKTVLNGFDGIGNILVTRGHVKLAAGGRRPFQYVCHDSSHVGTRYLVTRQLSGQGANSLAHHGCRTIRSSEANSPA